MSQKGFTLGELLGAKTHPCRVRGCSRTWSELTGGKQLPGARPAPADGEGAGMCEPCRQKWSSLADTTRPCARPGCSGTFPWSRMEQLEAWVARRQPPRRLCTSCEGELAQLETKHVPCSAPGCTRTATITPEAQLMAQHAPAAAAAAAEEKPEDKSGDKSGGKNHPPGITITGPLCEPCADVAERIFDRNIHCGINGCKRKWVWKADEQLATFAAGKPDQPPRRMCEPCRNAFGKLAERQVRCRASGCKKTWTWTREDQLDACNADQPPPKAPARLCDSCFKIWSGLKDIERPCRQPGCAKTWTDRRGAQLARQLRGKTGDPYPQYCEDHAKRVDLLQDREIPCRTEGCSHTWTWTRQQQLAAGVEPPSVPVPPPAEAAPGGAATDEAHAAAQAEMVDRAEGDAIDEAAESVPAPAEKAQKQLKQPQKEGRRKRRRREVHPPARHCTRCTTFLKDKKTIEIPCKQCSTPIFWPPESQLQTFLGNWAEPTLCGACKRDVTEAQRLAAKEALRAQATAGAESASAPPAPAEHAPPEPAGSPDGG